MRGPITQSWTIWNEPRPGDSLDDRRRWVDGPPAGHWASAGVEVVAAEQLRGAVEALLVATTTVEEWEACHKVKHPDPEGFRRAAIEQGKAVLDRLGGQS